MISFVTPWLLGALILLPGLWWLLRVMPPAARKVPFPALALLRDLPQNKQVPARSPWWLLLLRLIIAALLIFACAHPIIGGGAAGPNGDGDRLIVIDNDWASARDWSQRVQALQALIGESARAHHRVVLLTTTPAADGTMPTPSGALAPQAAIAMVDEIKPMPWSADWHQTADTLGKLNASDFSDTIWLASGLGGTAAANFTDALKKFTNARVLTSHSAIYAVQPPQLGDSGLAIPVQRGTADGTVTLTLNAMNDQGQTLTQMQGEIAEGKSAGLVPIDLPVEIRNQVSRFALAGNPSAAMTALLDNGWTQHPIGVVGEASELDKHSLLSSLYYVDRALKPYADLHIGALGDLLKQHMSALIVTDRANLSDADKTSLLDWVKQGGVLLRFGDEELASSTNAADTELLPVHLRGDDRAMGGSMSWAKPQTLQSFPDNSPFNGLAVPEDVNISRQLLAEPEADLASKTWASLADGTPLVTAKHVGQGLSILFHVPARSDWSNLPLSGLFVDMLRRITSLAHNAIGGAAGENANFASLPPLHMMDGFGNLQPPTPAAQALTSQALADHTLRASPQHPPGLYGNATLTHAFNLGTGLGPFGVLQDVPSEDIAALLQQTDAQPWLLGVSFILLLVDMAISLLVRGLRPRLSRPAVVAILLMVLMCLPHAQAAAMDDKAAIDMTAQTYLAYVRSGDANTDHVAQAGLIGLANILQRRTSLDHVGVAGVDPATDDLTFFPILYWPLLPSSAPLSQAATQRVNAYIHHGGMILFDTMNGEPLPPMILRHLLNGIAMPTLAQLPDKHVLLRSFYLLHDVPGRYNNSDFWLEPSESSSFDSVASVLYGSNGWAAAWALSPNGEPLYPCVPGGEIQREMAFRFGVNLVMYALTGNYKADQVHAQALLEKLGQ